MMKSEFFIVYHNQKKKPPLQLEQRLNKKSLSLCILSHQLSKWKVENNKHERCLSSHKRMENQNFMDRFAFHNSDQNHSSILKDISKIRFPNLKSLSVFNCKIETIEGFAKVFTPTIESVNLSMMISKEGSNRFCTSN